MWNRDWSKQTYLMYAKTRPSGMDTAVTSEPDGISKMCLSCHDGIIAPATYGNHSRAAAYVFSQNVMGTVPSSDHPISFVYDTALANRKRDLYDPSTKLSSLPGRTGTITADMLFQNRMECSSCHDVHNTKAVPGTKLLVKDNAGSALCLTCHNK